MAKRTRHTAAQTATVARLTALPGVAWHREAWEGRTLLLGVAYHPKEEGGHSNTLMFRITPDGKEQGV